PQLGPERPLAVSVYAMAGSAVIHVYSGTPFDASLFRCGEVRKYNCRCREKSTHKKDEEQGRASFLSGHPGEHLHR
ncbi:MAG: hypothetical protein V3U53_03490, partial [bacterium]